MNYAYKDTAWFSDLISGQVDFALAACVELGSVFYPPIRVVSAHGPDRTKLKTAGPATKSSNVIGRNKSDPTKVILKLSINSATGVLRPFIHSDSQPFD